MRSPFSPFFSAMSTSSASAAFPSLSPNARRIPRRFLPLNPDLRGSGDGQSEAVTVSNGDAAASVSVPRLAGIVFDVDGTLCEPQNYMFKEMRSALDIPATTDILEHIYSLPPEDQEAAHEKIRMIERAAMAVQRPQPGLETLMVYLKKRGIRKGICTRNFDLPVSHLLSKFLPDHDFSPIITRAFRPPKPHPAGILHIAKQWGLSDGGDRLIMVGDSIDDMTAGRRAGAATVLLSNPANAALKEHPDTDLSIDRLDKLIDILDTGFESGPGEAV